MLLKIKRGFDLPIDGLPRQSIDAPMLPRRVALLGADYPGLKPELRVTEGDVVKQGESLFIDRRTGVNYTAPASGILSEVNRGPKRSLHSIVIRVDGDRQVEFPTYSASELATLSSATIKENLLQAGLWAAFRTRPFNRNPHPETTPHAIFVVAIDTEPLAVDPTVVIAAYAEDFANGLNLVSRLSHCDTYVCIPAAASIPLPDNERVKTVQVSGPHPAGLVGTHIHHIDPVGAGKTAWHLNYQDVIAIGRLFKYGQLWTTRIISLGGPPVLRPRLVPVTSGCAIADVVANELQDGKFRLISGSVLSGRRVTGQDQFLGRYHTQISAIDEAASASRASTRHRFSLHGILARLMARGKKYSFDTALNGRIRPLIPLEAFEQVMPLDIMVTPLLKSLLIQDSETAGALGCLELAEEDLALCEFVCSSKQNYASALRRCLDELDVERT